MAKTVGDIMSNGLVVIGDPIITAVDTDNLLHTQMITEINDRVRMVVGRTRHRWCLQRDILQLTDDITTEYVAATAGSATISSVTSAGAAADNFGSVSAGMKIVVGSDTQAYKIDTVTTAASPDTITIEANYNGTTTTASSFVIFQDTYSTASLSSYDEIRMASYGDASAWPLLSGYDPTYELHVVDFSTIFRASGGNLYRNTSGKPKTVCHVASESSGNPQLLFWPYPTDDYPIEVFYSQKFSDQESFSSNIFGAGAPDLAYDFVDYGVRAVACRYADFAKDDAEYWEKRANAALADLVARENRDFHSDGSLGAETYRNSSMNGVEARSQIAFDHKPAWR